MELEGMVKASTMNLLTKSCVYGLRATLYVASFCGERHFVPIREISEKLGLSFHFLTKILQKLTEAGLMESYRGPSGKNFHVGCREGH